MRSKGDKESVAGCAQSADNKEHNEIYKDSASTRSTNLNRNQGSTICYQHDKSIQSQRSVLDETFDLNENYEIVEFLGAGTYGVVCAARDLRNNTIVAIKKCKNIFQCLTIAKRTLREIKLLRLFRHDNIVKILDILEPVDSENFNSIYLVFEIMDTDLAQVIRSPQKLRDQHVQYFTYQLLLGLRYLHNANVVHRDLKPRNILVNADCHIKIADFGLARIYDESNDHKIACMTEYVTTRWYRAPEVLAGWSHYSSAIDMWALGCIVAELISRNTLFPGNSSINQLECILKYLGKPSSNFIRNCRKPAHRNFMSNYAKGISAFINELNPEEHILALDLVKRLLLFEPSERLSASDALVHPYILPFYRSYRPNESPAHIMKDDFEFEEVVWQLEDYRESMLQEIDKQKCQCSPRKERSFFFTALFDTILSKNDINGNMKESGEESKWTTDSEEGKEQELKGVAPNTGEKKSLCITM